MVSIVTGNGLGFLSGASLGLGGGLDKGEVGRGGQQLALNAVNGNLLLQRRDELLTGRGPDLGLVRTYNSQARFDGDNDDNWRLGMYRQIKSFVPGQSVVRVDGDGHEFSYSYVASRNLYVCTEGSGPDDTLALSGSRWTFTDGESGITEGYDWDGSNGRLVDSQDRDGNKLSYFYNGRLLSSVVSSSNETILFDYEGNNLKQTRLVFRDISGPNPVDVTRVSTRYYYNAQSRLERVVTDLTPEDGSIADGKTYETRYTYAGDSDRLATLQDTDGTSLSFDYIDQGGEWRLKTLTDVAMNRSTSFVYDLANRSTTITDAQNGKTVISYDAKGLVTSTSMTASDGSTARVQYQRDASGNVLEVLDALNQKTVYGYDAQGNQVWQRDATGQCLARRYDERNLLISETRFSSLDPNATAATPPAGARSSYFVYDQKGHLRFQISAGGQVSEYRYNAQGQREAELIYTQASHTPASAPTHDQMVSWLTGIDRSQCQRTDYLYDFRGNVRSKTQYARTNAAGEGIADTDSATTTYVYDQSGRLLSSLDPRAGSTSLSYDGLGRLLSTTNAALGKTLTVYDDARAETRITDLAGLTTVHQYNKAGELMAVIAGDLPASRLHYDSLGRLRASVSATGTRTASLYDTAGNKVADIDATGAMTEYQYDRNDRLIKTTLYSYPLNADQLGQLFDANGQPKPLLLASIKPGELVRPSASVDDRSSLAFYDAAGRLSKTVDALGYVTETRYDGMGLVSGSTAYAKPVDVSKLVAGAAPGTVKPQPDAERDRITRNFYDADGRLLAKLDAEGYLSEQVINPAGQLVRSVRYSTATDASKRATGSLAELRPARTGQDQISAVRYDGRGLVVAEVSAEGYLVEHRYDRSGNRIGSTSYAKALGNDVAQAFYGNPQAADIAALRIAASVAGKDQVISLQYDALNRIKTEIGADGSVSEHQYDTAGNQVRLTQALGSNEERVQRARFDRYGRLTGELSGEGAALLRDNMSASEAEAIWQQYGVRHNYDASGRRVSTTDARGQTRYFYYDFAGRLTHTIIPAGDLANPEGEISEIQYNAFGQAQTTLRYSRRLPAASFKTLKGGLLDRSSTEGKTLLAALARIEWGATDARVRQTYNQRGELSVRYDEDGVASRFQYNAFGEISSKFLPQSAGRTLEVRYDYDRRGLLKKESAHPNPLQPTLNLVSQRVYDAFGRVTDVLDSQGRVNHKEYDRQGRVVASTDPLQGVRRSSYDAFDRVLTVTDATNQTTTVVYDDTARSITTTTQEGVVTVTTRNRHGQTLQVKDGRGGVSTFLYDKAGRLKESTGADGNKTADNRYDKAGLLTETRDANGLVTRFDYDAAGRVLSKTVDPAGLKLVTRFEFDGMGRTVKQTEPDGRVTRTEFDLKGQVAAIIVDPDGAKLSTRYSYDPQGRQLTVRSNHPGQPALTRYEYDIHGRRIAEIVDPDGAKLTTRYQYDKLGNVIQKDVVLDANTQQLASTRYAYDENNRLVATLDATGALSTRSYDAEGRLTATLAYALAIDLGSLTPAENPERGYSLQELQALTTTTDGDRLEQLTYDRDGHLRFAINGEGTVSENRYDGNGNVVMQIVHGQTLALSERTDLSTSALLNRFATIDAADRVSRTAYDAANRPTLSLNALNTLTIADYDATGRLVKTRQLAKAVTLGNGEDMALLTKELTGQAAWSRIALDAARDRASYTVYDLAGRPRFAVDGEGYVVETRYELNTRQISTIRYATPITLSADQQANSSARTEALIGQLAGALPTGAPATAIVNSSRTDLAGRVIETVDGENVFTHYDYDLKRHAVQTTVGYGRPDASRSEQVYDDAGRLIEQTQGLGTAEATTVRHRYDGAGNRIATIDPRGVALASSDSDWARAERARLGFVDGARLDQLRSDWNGYWASSSAGQVSPYAGGQLTRNAGDTATFRAADGSVLQVRRDALFSDIAAQSTAIAKLWRDSYGFDYRGNLENRVQDSNAPARKAGVLASQLSAAEREALMARYTTRYRYDAAGRQVEVRDAAGAASQTEYNAFGNAVKATDPRGQSSYFYFDHAGRQIGQITTAREYTQTVYDAFGNVSQITRFGSPVTGELSVDYLPTVTAGNQPAALNLVTTFGRDKLNRQTSVSDNSGKSESYELDAFGQKTLQRVRVTVDGAQTGEWRYEYDRRGKLIRETLPITSPDTGGQPQAVVNRYVYDASGNRTQAIEADGLPEKRSTILVYDKAGRLLEQRNNSVRSYTVAGGWQDVTPTEQFRYDARGNLISKTDAAGGRTLSYYDATNQKSAEISASGTYTQWLRDPAGNAGVVRVYDTPLSLPTNAGGTPPAPVDAAKRRETEVFFDVASRITSTLVRNVNLGEYNSQQDRYEYYLGNVQTRKVYDLAGNLVREEDGRGNSEFSWYDEAGRKRLMLDREGYATRWDYSAGKLIETRYAKPYTGNATETTPLATVLAQLDGTAADNRVIEQEFDMAGRVTVRRLLNLQYGEAGKAGDGKWDGSYSQKAGSAETRLAYNALGKVIRSTDADGLVTTFSYDALGRETRREEGSFTGFDNATVSRRITTDYDGHDQIIRRTELGRNDASSDDDRITRYEYDAVGRNTAEVNAANARTEYGYDAAGRRTLMQTSRSDAAGAKRTEWIKTEYDALGREIKRSESWQLAGALSPQAGDVREIRYNAHGEITGKRLNGGNDKAEWQEYAEFDALGRAWKTNSGKGVSKAYVFDANGNATLSIESTGADLRNLTLDQAKNLSGTAATISVFDRRNLISETIQPRFTAEEALARIDAARRDVKAGEPYAPTTLEVNRTYVSGSGGGSVSSVGHVHTSAITTGTTQAVSIDGTLESVTTERGGGSIPYFAGYYRYQGQSMTVSLPALGWYGEGQFELEYQDSQGLVTTTAGSTNSQATLALNRELKGDYTLRLFRRIAGSGRLLLGEQTASHASFGSWSAIGSARPSISNYNQRASLSLKPLQQFHLAGQPDATTRLSFSFRTAGSNAAFTAIDLPQMVVEGRAQPGWFVIDWSQVAAGDYEYKYQAFNSAGQVINTGDGQARIGGASSRIVQSGGAAAPQGPTSKPNVGISQAGSVMAVAQSAGEQMAGNISATKITTVTSQMNGTIPYTTTTVTYQIDNATFNLPNLPSTTSGGSPEYQIEFVCGDVRRQGLSYSGQTTITVGINAQVSGNASYKLYKYVAGGRMLVAEGSVQLPAGSRQQEVGMRGNSETREGFNIWAPTNKQSIPLQFHIKDQDARVNDVYLYYREAGSNGAYRQASVPRFGFQGVDGWVNTSGWFALNGNQFVTGRQYEFQYFAYGNEDGVQKILNRERGSFFVSDSGPQIEQSPLPLGGNGGALFVGNTLHLFDQGRTPGNPVGARSSSLLFRRVGTQNWTASDPARFATSAGEVPGWFQWPVDGLEGPYEFEFTAYEGYNKSGRVLNQIGGKFTVADQASRVLEYYPITVQPATVRIKGQPAEASEVRVGHRRPGSNAAWTWTTAAKSASEAGVFTWDARNLVTDPKADVDYEYVIEARTGSGQVVNRASGLVRLGAHGEALGAPVAERKPTILEFSPSDPRAVRFEMYYRARKDDAPRQTVTDQTKTDGYLHATFNRDNSGGGNRFSLDATALVPKSGSQEYEFFYDLYDAAGNIIARVPGSVTLGLDRPSGMTELKWVIDGVGKHDVAIHRKQAHNAFGEISSETDGLGRTTELVYNTLGKLIEKRAPETSVTGENGFTYRIRPTTRQLYSLGGRLVQTVDANGNANRFRYLAATDSRSGEALLAEERHADGGRKQFSYDEFGQIRRTRNELDQVTSQTFDRMGRLTEVARPERTLPDNSRTVPTDRFEYDEAGNRIAYTDANGFRSTTDYDIQGRVTRTLTAEQRATQYSYVYDKGVMGVGGIAAGGYIKTTTDANGRTMIDKTDYFGRTTWHKDLGGNTFEYRYNTAGWLKQQIGSNGQNISYEHYANGYVKEMRDSAIDSLTQYGYDEEGNKTFEAYGKLSGDASNRQYFQVSRIRYDELNRVAEVTDPTANIRYEYDAASNVRHVWASYHDGKNGTLRVQDYWYAYDRMNRFTVTMGELSTGARASRADDVSVKIVNGRTGVEIGYNVAGQRISANYGAQATMGADGTADRAHLEEYSYSTDGFLEDVKIDGKLRARRVNDAAGRVAKYFSYNPDGTILQNRVTTYDKDNHVKTQIEAITRKKSDGGLTTDESTTVYDYLADGTLDKTTQTGKTDGKSNDTTTTTRYSYQWFDAAKQSEIKVSARNTNLPDTWAPGFSRFEYDVNGHTKAVYDEEGKRALRYFNNSQGIILRRDELDKDTIHRYRQYYYLDGKRIGDVSNDGPSRDDYAQTLSRLAQTPRSKDEEYRNWTPVSSADFDQNYEPISPEYPGAAAGSYTAHDGDTLQSIALAVWGDSALWTLLADANGLKGSEPLRAGQTLVLPNKVTNLHHNASTFKPYNPGEALGNTDPTLPAPPPPPSPKEACGGLGQIIMIVVAVIVTIYTAGAASALMAGGSIGGFGATMAAGAAAMSSATLAGAGAAMIGAAVGSAVSQGVGIAIGAQDKFSWKQVGTSALAAGISAGVGGALKGAEFLKPLGATWSRIAAGAIQGATGSLVGQLSQGRFNWRGIAAGAAGGAASAGVGQALQGTDVGNLLGKYGISAVQGLVGGATNQLVAQRGFNGRQLFGNTVSQVGATYIGDNTGEGALFGEEGGWTHMAAHAALGATSARIQRQDGWAGALGGATASYLDSVGKRWLGEALPDSDNPAGLVDAFRSLMPEVSRLGGAIAAKVFDRDVMVASNAAVNTTQFNGLSDNLFGKNVRGFIAEKLGLAKQNASQIADWVSDQLNERGGIAPALANGLARDVGFYSGIAGKGIEMVDGLVQLVELKNMAENALLYAALDASGMNNSFAEWGKSQLRDDYMAMQNLSAQATAYAKRFADNPWQEAKALGSELLVGSLVKGFAEYQEASSKYEARSRGGQAAIKEAFAEGYAAGGLAVDVALTLIAVGKAAKTIATVGRQAGKLAGELAAKLETRAPSKTPTPTGPTAAEAVGEKQTPSSTKGCFVAGTPVWTREGLKAIEAIQIGDYVLSQPELTGERAYRRVNDVFTFEEKSIFLVSYIDAFGNSESIEATPNHPFFVHGTGWTGAEYLEAGDVVELHDGSLAVIAEIRDTGRFDQVYNFEVDGFHTYYVGQLGVWVHNTNCFPKEVKSALEAIKAGNGKPRTYTAAEAAEVRQKYPELKHIKEGDQKLYEGRDPRQGTFYASDGSIRSVEWDLGNGKRVVEKRSYYADGSPKRVEYYYSLKEHYVDLKPAPKEFNIFYPKGR
ncbi:polymorphic toxin-type HINT domain-containing protein [Parachitinimonas caeni]|uniref:Polymorphic toxin-type HINT domain-containing protein n=1 Tax=Parachitinimonas caeni TaxID=3031301 RepID=A0ABT7DZ55_9NEIS|nr:polymorphic toxin-type HINT domain-containing protein [Parachitinimonas caeni]MDK2124358.1 polymorphic toxin-type HINT domain-containing protein [Parachitinimonas caeni]